MNLKGRNKVTPEFSMASMTDIVFLLLIFFLVTTTMNVDSGISKKLSEKPPKDYVPPMIKEKNIFFGITFATVKTNQRKQREISPNAPNEN